MDKRDLLAQQIRSRLPGFAARLSFLPHQALVVESRCKRRLDYFEIRGKVERHRPYAFLQVDLYQHRRIRIMRITRRRIANVERGMRPGRLRQIGDGRADAGVPFDQQHVARTQCAAQILGITGSERLVAGCWLIEVAGKRAPEEIQDVVHRQGSVCPDRLSAYLRAAPASVTIGLTAPVTAASLQHARASVRNRQ